MIEIDRNSDDNNNENTNNSISDTEDEENGPSPIYNQKLLDVISSPAKTFPFELDTFQFEAIKSLETENTNLLITAHTSAGKTVIAEYAIAKALKNNQRVIYTSPIKALSNQKYREFTEKFGYSNIGLITGDVTKRKNASILVMTTEILRNMLYKGGSALREVAFVIFDEVHYMRDVERGVVWEESIILLNKKITLIFLSATLSNSDDFALWVTDLKGKQCKIIGTEERPIVLEHYVLPRGSDSLYLVASSKTKHKFLDHNFEYAQGLKDKQKTYKQMEQQRKRNKLKISDLQLLLHLLYKNDWCPAIVFAFSKREVEANALALNDAINLCSKEESETIEGVFNNAIDSLSDKDRELPAVRSLLPLLKKGIGVHHGGILPILKEVTEILFQEGMIKVLFATETFAMGVNMPAKCVVFTAVEKFDGQSTRFLNSGEYIQMSGRAGRRGIDKKGIVILMMTPNLTKESCVELMCGKAAALTSSFRLTYNMLLNISKNIRSNVGQIGDGGDGDEGKLDIIDGDDGGDGDEEEGSFSYQTVIEKSFYRFLMTQRIPQIEGRMKELRDLLNVMESAKDFDDMKIYFDLYQIKERILNKAHDIMIKPYIINKYLQYGRIVFVEVKYDEKEEEKENKMKDVWGWGVILGFSKRFQPETYFVDILIPSQINKKDAGCDGDKIYIPRPINDGNIDLKKPVNFKKLDNDKKREYGLQIVRFNTKCITKISSVRIHRLRNRIIDDRDYYEIYDKLQNVHKHFMNKIPTLDVFDDLNILTLYKESNKISLREDFEDRLPKLEERMIETVYFKNKWDGKEKDEYKESEDALYGLYKQYKKSKKEYNKLTNKIQTYNVGQFASELKCKCRVLRKLEYLNEENILTSKGIAASYLEINHGILITELMFDGFFNKLKAEEICAVLSVFIMEKGGGNNNNYNNKYEANIKYPVPEIVHNCYQEILIKGRGILLIKKECGLTEEFGLFDNISFKNEDDYIGGFVPDLIKPIFQWVNGADFVDVNKLTPKSLFEGALIRLIKRLRDIINQLVDAAKAIGNQELAKKFGECVDKLQHGIVFAASLYIDDMEDDDDEDEEEEEDEDEENEEELEEEDTESENTETKQAMKDIFGSDDDDDDSD